MTRESTTTPNARYVRAAAWCGLVLLSAVRLIGLRSEDPVLEVLSEAAYILPLLFGCAGALAAAMRSSGAERRFWWGLAGSLGLLTLSECYFTYYTLYVDPAGPALPAPFELLQVGALLIFFAMVVSMGRFSGVRTWVRRARFFTGAAAGLAAFYVFSLEFIAAPVLGGLPAVQEGAVVVSAFYPVLAVAFLTSTYGVVFGLRSTLWRSWERLVIVALTIYGAALFMMPFWYRALVSNAPQTALGELADVGLAVGPYLLFLGAVYRLTTDYAADALAPGPALDDTAGWLRVVYPVVLALLVPVIGVHALTHAGQPQAAVLLATALSLAALLLVRNWLATLEAAEHQQMSSRDGLTGLANERHLQAELPINVADANRYGGQVALVVLDVDDLTRINELYGHPAGDQVMRSIASVLVPISGDAGSVYRIGSDEFALVMPGLSPEEAADLARSILRSVERDVGARGTGVTVSAGIATLNTSHTVDALISDAFTALQTAKLLHRGSVVVFGDRRPVLPGPEERLEIAHKESYLATMRALAAAVDARDPVSKEHSRRVASLSRRLGEALGLEALRLSALETAGFVHDIGKLALPDELLWKRGVFTADEEARMREHVELGEHILRSTELAFMLPWVRAHHERWDGTGYPDGLAREAIPLEARIIAVCDSYDAMTAGIWQISPLSHEAALQEVDLGMGTQFDPRVAEAFIRLLSQESRQSGGARSN